MWHVYDFRLYFSSWEAFKDKAQTLENVSFGSEHALFETEPTKWFPVSNVPYMLCTTHFHLKICSHNLCYFFCAIFCGCFSEGRILMPLKFMISNPQRACDVCGVSWVYSALFVLVNFQLNTLFMPPAINHFIFSPRKCLQDPSHNKWIGSNLAIPGNMMKMVN